jgi:hypothetical protein
MTDNPITGHGVQLVVDCREPHALADWWAETLAWQVEPQDENFIRSMIDQGLASEADTVEHRGKLVWREGCAINPPEGSATTGLRMLFQWVPEPKAGKNRVHVDLRPVGVPAEELRERLLARGAEFLHEGRQGPHTWVTMADPEGNEFCL